MCSAGRCCPPRNIASRRDEQYSSTVSTLGPKPVGARGLARGAGRPRLADLRGESGAGAGSSSSPYCSSGSRRAWCGCRREAVSGRPGAGGGRRARTRQTPGPAPRVGSSWRGGNRRRGRCSRSPTRPPSEAQDLVGVGFDGIPGEAGHELRSRGRLRGRTPRRRKRVRARA